MKKYFLSVALSMAIATATLAQRTPQPSSAAGITQTIGITDFSLKYSRPNIKGRTVFRDSSALAPYNQLWRTGANQPSTLEASTEFWFGDKKVPAGKYALLTIPGGGVWTVILNKNFSVGTEGYKQTDDVARVTAVPTSAEYLESFTMDFSNITDSTGHFNISWGAVSVPVKITVATQELTMAGLNKAVAEKPEDPGTLQSAAGYLLSKGRDLSQALAMADKSIGIKETFSNLWLKAQILNKLGKVAEALPVAQKALTVGAASGEGSFASFYKGQIENGIKAMQAKLPKATDAVKAVQKGKKK